MSDREAGDSAIVALMGFVIGAVVAGIALIAISLLLAGCCDQDELIADDQPVADAKADICVQGLESASAHTGLGIGELIPWCESVGAGGECMVVCSARGVGLVCDADGCEEHVRP